MNYIYAIQLLLRKCDYSHGFITLCLCWLVFITFIIILMYRDFSQEQAKNDGSPYSESLFSSG